MKHFTSGHFWQCFNSLPPEIQNLARQNYELLKSNPSHPSLHFKSVCRGRFRSVRVGLHYRALERVTINYSGTRNDESSFRHSDSWNLSGS